MSQTPEFAPAHVSVVNEFPEDLYDAMRTFVRTHPHWDQYRLMQVAVAGFLFQQGSRERAVSRHYLDGLFDRGGSAVPPPEAAAEARPASPARHSVSSRSAPVKPLRQAPGAALGGGAPLPPVATPLTQHLPGSQPSRRVA